MTPTYTSFLPGSERRGPAVGSPFPALVLPDQSGQPVDLQRARAGRKALVIFYRSAEW